MAEVTPFRGLLYNPEKIDTSSVVAPPYDIVTPELKEELYKKSPYNIIRIDYGKDEKGDTERDNRYTRASRFLNEWIKNDILRQDQSSSFYCYQINYRVDGEEKTLRGVMGAVRIEELGSGRIRPHEVTYSKPKSDRLNIIRFCRANISPIFSLYSSKKKLTSSILEHISEKGPFLEAKNGDGFVHRIWRINDTASIQTIKEEFTDKDIFIADGHHRYETALEFRNEMKGRDMVKTGRESFNYVLMFLANLEDDGLTLLPTHRMVRVNKAVQLKEVLDPYFDMTVLNFDIKEGRKILKAIQSNGYCLGMFLKGEDKLYALRFKASLSEINTHETLRGLGVTILHNFIFEKLLKIEDFEYEMDLGTVIERVKNGPYHAAFFLAPTRIEDVRRVALAGQRMPPKSTYFYPKLLTGMVIYKF